MRGDRQTDTQTGLGGKTDI
jgi:hypothetical protein